MEGDTEARRLASCESQERRQQALAEIFQGHRQRLRAMIHLRIDRRVQGRVDPSDVIQEAFLEASRTVDDYLRTPTVSPYLWIRFLAGRKLQEAHRRHLGAQMRDAHREISLHRGAVPQATSEELAAQLLGKGP